MRKKWYQNVDWTVLVAWLLLVCIGLTAIYSATHGPASEYLLDTVQRNFQRQLQWVILSCIATVAILLIPIRHYQNGAFIVYGISILLVVSALLFGREINGARSWIALGPFSLQSSELAKVGTVLAVAQLFGNARHNPNVFRLTLIAVGMILLPAVLIVLQNDTGTALVFLALIPIALFWSGIPLPTVGLLVAPAVAGYLAIVFWPVAIVFCVLVTATLYLSTKKRGVTALGALFSGGTVAVVMLALNQVLQPHQIARIASFVNPEAYRLTSGFHIIQARAAIGSGGLTGKGFMQGTQTQMAFVPEQSTDFIFSVIGEEFGFIGAMLVLLLFGYLLIRLVTIGIGAKHTFAGMFAAGTSGLFFAHVLINIGMAIGVMPVIGIPLPFMSYGGSALLANTILVAIVLNFYMRRHEFPRYAT